MLFHDLMQVTLWCTESYTVKSVLEEHTQWITDVRFGPHTSRLATSSADKTVRVWDVDNVSIGYFHIIVVLFFYLPMNENLIPYWGAQRDMSLVSEYAILDSMLNRYYNFPF